MPCATCNKTGPGAVQMGRNIAAAGARVAAAFLAGRPVAASLATAARRWRECEGCAARKAVPSKALPGRVFNRCLQCGCWLDGEHFAKLRLATEACPLGKWGAEP